MLKLNRFQVGSLFLELCLVTNLILSVSDAFAFQPGFIDRSENYQTLRNRFSGQNNSNANNKLRFQIDERSASFDSLRDRFKIVNTNNFELQSAARRSRFREKFSMFTNPSRVSAPQQAVDYGQSIPNRSIDFKTARSRFETQPMSVEQNPGNQLIPFRSIDFKTARSRFENQGAAETSSPSLTPVGKIQKPALMPRPVIAQDESLEQKPVLQKPALMPRPVFAQSEKVAQKPALMPRPVFSKNNRVLQKPALMPRPVFPLKKSAQQKPALKPRPSFPVNNSSVAGSQSPLRSSYPSLSFGLGYGNDVSAQNPLARVATNSQGTQTAVQDGYNMWQGMPVSVNHYNYAQVTSVPIPAFPQMPELTFTSVEAMTSPYGFMTFPLSGSAWF